MYYIKRNGKAFPTNNASEVTKENFLVEPGGENRVWLKLEQYEYDQQTGEKKVIRNQINAVNPGDFDNFAAEWKRQGIVMTLLHDPRLEMQGEGVEAKLAALNARIAEEGKSEGEGAPAKPSKKPIKNQ